MVFWSRRRLGLAWIRPTFGDPILSWGTSPKIGGFTRWQNKHNYGKSPFLMGKSTINGHFQ